MLVDCGAVVFAAPAGVAGPRRGRAAALLLLVTAKASNVYWIPLGLPLLILSRRGKPPPASCGGDSATAGWLGQAARHSAFFAVMAAGMFGVWFVIANDRDNIPGHQFNCLFQGILNHSADPAARLGELGLADTRGLVGQSAFGPGATPFLRTNASRLSLVYFLRVAWREPRALLRLLKHAADRMQDLSLDELGQRGRRSAVSANPLSARHQHVG